MKKIFRMFGAAAMAAAVFGTASCEKNPQDETKEYTLELANPADAEIFVNEGHTASTTVALVLGNITRDQLIVTATENEGNWCSATVSEDADAIIVTPGANDTADDKTATFEVSADVAGITPVVIKVTSTGSETEYYVRLVSDIINEGEWSKSIDVPAEGGEITITVNTNAEKWYYDPGYGTTDWFTTDKTSGKNGETITFTFEKNSENLRNANVTFTYEEGGWDGEYLTFMQNATGATAVKVFAFDKTAETKGDELSNGYTVNFDVAGDPEFNFYIEKDGGIDFKFVKSGTTEEYKGADDMFGCFSGYLYDEYYNTVGTYYTLGAYDENSTGNAINLDMIITSAGSTTELFRFKITQAGN